MPNQHQPTKAEPLAIIRRSFSSFKIIVDEASFREALKKTKSLASDGPADRTRLDGFGFFPCNAWFADRHLYGRLKRPRLSKHSGFLPTRGLYGEGNLVIQNNAPEPVPIETDEFAQILDNNCDLAPRPFNETHSQVLNGGRTAYGYTAGAEGSVPETLRPLCAGLRNPQRQSSTRYRANASKEANPHCGSIRWIVRRRVGDTQIQDTRAILNI
ncbi:hypothetical protein BDV10DRAFT_186902 [Aspergillus recurvatus]